MSVKMPLSGFEHLKQIWHETISCSKISTHSCNAQIAVSRLKTGKITWLGTKYFRAFRFLPLGLGRPQRRWMPDMPEAVLRHHSTPSPGRVGTKARIKEFQKWLVIRSTFLRKVSPPTLFNSTKDDSGRENRYEFMLETNS